MSENKRSLPYKSLGNHLRRLRERRNESLIEASGAIEVEPDTLSKIEQGSVRPDEDILLLLLSHFNARDEEAARLWDLAKYDLLDLPMNDAVSQTAGGMPPVILIQQDSPVMYTDTVHVAVNDFGVVVNFMHAGAGSEKPVSVSRVGMSKEHARSLIEVLRKTLAASEPKSLPSPQRRRSARKKSTE